MNLESLIEQIQQEHRAQMTEGGRKRVLRETKRCPGCRKTKSILDFYLNAASKDGRSHQCKTCSKVATIRSMQKADTARIRIARAIEAALEMYPSLRAGSESPTTASETVNSPSAR